MRRLARTMIPSALSPNGPARRTTKRMATSSSLSDSAFHQLGFQAPYNVPIACVTGVIWLSSSFQPAGPLTGPYLFRFIALTGASRPLSGGGEDEHSLQVPRHGHQTPFAAHFLQPAQ